MFGWHTTRFNPLILILVMRLPPAGVAAIATVVIPGCEPPSRLSRPFITPNMIGEIMQGVQSRAKLANWILGAHGLLCASSSIAPRPAFQERALAGREVAMRSPAEG
jgi:hypothetical protein